jgi:hypothetical protein
MVLSVKPFGCLPSTMSDGVQYKVLDDFPAALFAPVETTGDGEVSVKSRIDMVLFEARMRARREFEAAMSESGPMSAETERLASGPRPARRLAAGPRRWVGTAATRAAAGRRGSTWKDRKVRRNRRPVSRAPGSPAGGDEPARDRGH